MIYLLKTAVCSGKRSFYNEDHFFLLKNADKQIDATLKRLDISYIDLLLLHQPYGDVKKGWQKTVL